MGDDSRILCFDPFLLKYLKLLEMAIVHVLGSIKDEHYFLSLAFKKKKNKLQGTLILTSFL
jgi:hypothetical protein